MMNLLAMIMNMEGKGEMNKRSKRILGEIGEIKSRENTGSKITAKARKERRRS